jgi:hypothetical protein
VRVRSEAGLTSYCTDERFDKVVHPNDVSGQNDVGVAHIDVSAREVGTLQRIGRTHTRDVYFRTVRARSTH